MFNRPRCRDWMPLVTQQLRLRNLIKIIGENINSCSSPKSQIYYTLHYNLKDDAFYTSEKIIPHGNGNADWQEINCQSISKSMSRSICIKVWQKNEKTLNQSDKQQNKKSISSDKHIDLIKGNALNSINDDKAIGCKITSDNDKMLFVWGVNFSGLILIAKHSSAKFEPNTLVFQMHGGYFASPMSLTETTMRQQLTINYHIEFDKSNYAEFENFSIQQDHSSKRKINFTSSPIEIAKGTTSGGTNITRSCDIKISTSSNSFTYNNDKLASSNSNSSLRRTNNDRMSSNTTDSYGKTNRELFQINSPRTSRSCSPVRDTILSQTLPTTSITSPSLATHSQLINKDLLDMLKTRYLTKKISGYEVNPSYTLDKLLELQKKQRKSKQCYEDVKEITERICMKSAFCLNLELISQKNRGELYYNSQRSKGTHSMGKTLNRLLFHEVHVKPEDILKSQELRRKIETARLRLQVFSDEKNRLKNNCGVLERKLIELNDINIELGSWLMSRYRILGREKDFILNEKVTIVDRRETLLKIQAMLRQMKAQFCGELKDIYPIERKCSDKYTISKIYLPNSDELCVGGPPSDAIFGVTPLSLSSALGYVAHVVQMCSIVLNIPLRNPIKHEGSRSRILDIVKEIPNSSREFPLYSRTHPPSKPVLYAVYLLNQNIAQLNLQANGITHCDLRATLANLLQLLNGPSIMGNFLLQLPNLEDNSSHQSVSTSSVDLNIVPIPSGLTSKPIDVINDMTNTIGEQRISRSVGSYSDENLSAADKDFYNSEPILTSHPVAIHLKSFAEDANI